MGFFLRVRPPGPLVLLLPGGLCGVQGVSAFVSAGGAISNMYGVMIARYKFFPVVKTKGMAAAPRLILFTSEHVGLPFCERFLPPSLHPSPSLGDA